jgi:uncharacterized protein YqiB (DUF1249 family)
MGTFRRHPKNLTFVHEGNYVKILRVIPFIQSMHSDALIWARTPAHRVEIKILDITPYTTMFSFNISYVGEQKWLPQIHLTVRCYHDARVAEVVNFQHHKNFHSRYSYPNPNMYQKNEKQQINRFLSEWLDYSLKTRCSFQPSEIPINA